VPAGGLTVDLGDQEVAGSLRSHTEDAPLDDHPQDSRRRPTRRRRRTCFAAHAALSARLLLLAPSGSDPGLNHACAVGKAGLHTQSDYRPAPRHERDRLRHVSNHRSRRLRLPRANQGRGRVVANARGRTRAGALVLAVVDSFIFGSRKASGPARMRAVEVVARLCGSGGGCQAIVRTTPPSTRSEAPVVAEACAEHR
jgi:hypothetical protein